MFAGGYELTDEQREEFLERISEAKRIIKEQECVIRHAEMSLGNSA
jgi:hypothetical protein